MSLVLEYAEKGDLLSVVAKNAPPSPREKCYEEQAQHVQERIRQARGYLVQILSALQYLDGLQVAHRDIKPENIVITSTAAAVRPGQRHCQDCSTHTENTSMAMVPTVKLADFGWAVRFQPGQRRQTLCGTPEYVPPEVLYDPCSYAAEYVDLWAVGVLALELVFGNTPFGIGDSCSESEITNTCVGSSSSKNNNGDDYHREETRDESFEQQQKDPPSTIVFEKIQRFRGMPLPTTTKAMRKAASSSFNSSPFRSDKDSTFPFYLAEIDPDYYDFCFSLLKIEPTRRMGVHQAIQHRFLRGGYSFSSPRSVLEEHQNCSRSHPISRLQPNVAQLRHFFQAQEQQQPHRLAYRR